MTIRGGEGPYESLLTRLIGKICTEIVSPDNVRNGARAVGGPIGSIYVGGRTVMRPAGWSRWCCRSQGY
ncbi:hypothetical protein [Methanogenium cariaci]|uniref:hypothetical protein n=1 Tax=Methanogenium cariaci TaxID=2197 RepID=UPI0007840D05|nr:hypothetical protein [Methanogenium cariaci]